MPISTPDPEVIAVDQLLPQTQCQQCGYAGCLPYAEAIVAGAAINKCPPGGQATIKALANLLDRKELPLDPHHGVEQPPQVAFIAEQDCIGCTKCLAACPVDAIVGAAKQMHTVIADHCTGCQLCLPPCPVDCISLRPAQHTASMRQRAQQARQHFQARQGRQEATKGKRIRLPSSISQEKAVKGSNELINQGKVYKQLLVAAARARVQVNKAHRAWQHSLTAGDLAQQQRLKQQWQQAQTAATNAQAKVSAYSNKSAGESVE
jgi:electron transport complex protein RnfB